MRTMVNGYGTKLKVVEHIIIKNFWEYYLTDRPAENDGDIREALVIGFETELGDVSLQEIKPYIIARTKKITEVMPPPNWTWVD
jgi:hypothetical protein